MNADEKTRYDRQMRLWGKATQQQLLLTEVRLVGITSAMAEVAKNLVLAGVLSVILYDDATVELGGVENSFLLQGSYIGEQRAVASARRLKSLNPYVAVYVAKDGSDEQFFSSGAAFRVVVASVQRTTDAFRITCGLHSTSADLMVLLVDFGHTAMGFFLSRRRGLSYEEQLRLLLFKNTALRPHVFQRLLLLMHMAECPEETQFFEKLVYAKEVVDRFDMSQISQRDIEHAAGVSFLERHLGTVIEATLMGGVIAQLIIGEVGCGRKGVKVEGYAWACYDSSKGTDIQVGYLHNS